LSNEIIYLLNSVRVLSLTLMQKKTPIEFQSELLKV